MNGNQNTNINELINKFDILYISDNENNENYVNSFNNVFKEEKMELYSKYDIEEEKNIININENNYQNEDNINYDNIINLNL